MDSRVSTVVVGLNQRVGKHAASGGCRRTAGHHCGAYRTQTVPTTPHNVTAVQLGALTAELDPVANAKLVIHTNRIDNPHNVTAAQIGAITAELDPVANAALAVHTNRADNPHSVTAAQIGAITNEQDLAALRAYGSPDTVESPTNWFVFNGAGTITAFNWAAANVIPWAIGGVPVTTIGARASGIVSVLRRRSQ